MWFPASSAYLAYVSVTNVPNVNDQVSINLYEVPRDNYRIFDLFFQKMYMAVVMICSCGDNRAMFMNRMTMVMRFIDFI